MKIDQEGTLLLVNKPYQWTSFDVVKKLRNALRLKKIGHAGTLDPLATGLLLIGVNRFTKKLNQLQLLEKEYHGVMEIGKTTPSYDLETSFDTVKDIKMVTLEQIEEARKKFIDEIQQLPPAHSAVKVGGERAYKKARKKQEVQLEPRKVHIYQFEFTSIDLPYITFVVKCSKGTYIRSLVNDFGQELSVGAYLKSLQRTAVGEYNLQDAWELEDLVAEIKSEHENH
jgi:tRNA pseudouridine55 synthase